MKLSIIIVNYNVKYFLEQCLNSIFASITDFDYEIIIVDNNSSDHSIPYLQSRFSQTNLHYIINDNNPGFSKANNQAIRQAKGEYLLILNPDTVLGEHVLLNVIRFLDQNPQAGAVGVKMINGYGQFLAESKRSVPSPWVSFCRLSGLQAVFPKSRIFGKYNLLYLNKDSINEVPVLAGAFMMIRYCTINQTGAFDEDFFMYGEDIDLSFRIEQAGYKNYYLPEKIIHYKGESTDKNNLKYIKAFYEAMLIFYKKHYTDSNRLLYSLICASVKLKLYFSGKKKTLGKHMPEKKTYTFDSSQTSFENIIEEMEKHNSENTRFLIYSPRTDITIGTKTIIHSLNNVSRK